MEKTPEVEGLPADRDPICYASSISTLGNASSISTRFSGRVSNKVIASSLLLPSSPLSTNTAVH